jgi:hypothetical protein
MVFCGIGVKATAPGEPIAAELTAYKDKGLPASSTLAFTAGRKPPLLRHAFR